MLKAVYDKSVPSGNLITTISGVITLLLTVLVGFGVIKPEQSTEIQTQTTSILNAVVVIWGAVSGLILVFKAKD